MAGLLKTIGEKMGIVQSELEASPDQHRPSRRSGSKPRELLEAGTKGSDRLASAATAGHDPDVEAVFDTGRSPHREIVDDVAMEDATRTRRTANDITEGRPLQDSEAMEVSSLEVQRVVQELYQGEIRSGRDSRHAYDLSATRCCGVSHHTCSESVRLRRERDDYRNRCFESGEMLAERDKAVRLLTASRSMYDR